MTLLLVAVLLIGLVGLKAQTNNKKPRVIVLTAFIARQNDLNLGDLKALVAEIESDHNESDNPVRNTYL